MLTERLRIKYLAQYLEIVPENLRDIVQLIQELDFKAEPPYQDLKQVFQNCIEFKDDSIDWSGQDICLQNISGVPNLSKEQRMQRRVDLAFKNFMKGNNSENMNM